MAQFGGNTAFDFHWDRSADVALALLREAADTFAKPTDGALTPDCVLRTLLWWFAVRHACPHSRWRPLRFFDGALQPPPAHDSYLMLAPGGARRHETEIIDRLDRIMSTACSEWTLGNPEEPDARDVLHALLDVLWSQRLIPRPPGNAYPRGCE